MRRISAQPPPEHQRARVLDHRVAAVVVREREHTVAAVHDPAQRLRIRHRRRQRLVAHDVEARLQKRTRHVEVEVVGRDDDHEIQPPVRGARRFRRRHLRVAPVHAVRIQSEFRPLRRRPSGVRREGAGLDPREAVQFGGHAVHVPDEGSGSAPDHPVAEAAPHPPSASAPIRTARYPPARRSRMRMSPKMRMSTAVIGTRRRNETRPP